MEETPPKPYLIRALHEWCVDNGYTPYLVVQVDADTLVPRAYVQEGQIALNISPLATNHLVMENDHIAFEARFSGVVEHIHVPVAAVAAIYARETGAGMGFEVDQDEPQIPAATPPTPSVGDNSPKHKPAPQPPVPPNKPPGAPRKPTLTIVK